MQRITHASAAAALPDFDSTGTEGYFTEGNPGTGTPATVISADWLNGVQEELVGVIVAAGLDPSGSDLGQVLKALKVLFRPVGVGQWFTGDAAHIPPGFVLANGATVNRVGIYADLWAFAQASGTLAADGADYAAHPGKYGRGNGATTFDLPNVAGDFLRVAGGGRNPGTHQADALKDHAHAYSIVQGGGFAGAGDVNSLQGTTTPAGGHYNDTTAAAGGGGETRPVNTAYHFIISF